MTSHHKALYLIELAAGSHCLLYRGSFIYPARYINDHLQVFRNKLQFDGDLLFIRRSCFALSFSQQELTMHNIHHMPQAPQVIRLAART